MAVQESAAQLSMTLKVQEYPTLKVGLRARRPRLAGAWGRGRARGGQGGAGPGGQAPGGLWVWGSVGCAGSGFPRAQALRVWGSMGRGVRARLPGSAGPVGLWPGLPGSGVLRPWGSARPGVRGVCRGEGRAPRGLWGLGPAGLRGRLPSASPPGVACGRRCPCPAREVFVAGPGASPPGSPFRPPESDCGLFVLLSVNCTSDSPRDRQAGYFGG